MKEYNTLDYYNKNAKLYFEQTVEGNLEENYNAFLSEITENSYILDFGCGSGRDSKYFIDKGYKVKAVDGSIEMCKLASKYIKQDVHCMKFEELNEKAQVVKYFETFSSTKRSEKVVWSNYVIKKL